MQAIYPGRPESFRANTGLHRLYAKRMDYEKFTADEKTIDAVVRNFEIIGEAANRIDDEFKHGHPELDWNYLRGFRNRIVHDYFGIDYEIVWSIITMDLSGYKEAIASRCASN